MKQQLKTNKLLGRELGVHPRQISKSRKRGWLWKDGKKMKYTAPTACYIILPAVPRKKRKKVTEHE